MESLPPPIQAAIASDDPQILQAALEALAPEERERVEALLQEATRRAIEAAALRRRPEEIVAALPATVRGALEQQDEAAFHAALDALPEGERRQAEAELAVLQTQQRMAAQQETQRDPRARFAALLRDIAIVATGDDGPRHGVEQALLQMEQSGWMLRGPVERIWAGERDQVSLSVGLDDQDTLLVERALEVLRQYETGERRTPAQVFAKLPEAVRVALEQRDLAAFEDALAALADEERARVEALLGELQNATAGPEPPRPPREAQGSAVDSRLARAAALPDAVRGAIEQQDEAAFVAALAALSATERARVEALLADLADEHAPTAPTPARSADSDDQRALIAGLPEPVRTALARGDLPALQAALAAMPPDAASAIIAQLQQAGIVGTAPQADGPRPDIDQVLQGFLPLLGDFALAAHGDPVARQLGEAALPRLEEGGWRLGEAVRRLWAGERDVAVLTEGIDPNSAVLVRQTLLLVEDGPETIFAAGSLQIASLRQQVEEAAAQALASGDAQQRAGLAQNLTEVAEQAVQQYGAPWHELAAYLRALAAQLREP
jgi:hypothetical protein